MLYHVRRGKCQDTPFPTHRPILKPLRVDYQRDQSDEKKIIHSPEWELNPKPSHLQSHACGAATGWSVRYFKTINY